MTDNSNKKTSLDNYESISVDDLYAYHKDFLENDIPITRKNKNGELVIVPISNLSVIFGKGKHVAEKYSFFARKGWRKEIDGDKIKVYTPKTDIDVSEDYQADENSDEKMRVEKYKTLSKQEKVSVLANKKQKLELLSKSEKKLTTENAGDMLNASSDANVMSKLSMNDMLQKIQKKEISEEEAKKETREIALQTTDIVKNVVDLLENKEGTQEVFSKLKNYSEGSTLSHSNRVFTNFVNFLFHYNTLINQGLINKLRIKFKKYYAWYYEELFPKKEIHSVEDVVEKGLGRISDQNLMTYSVGALLHDIGKVDDLEYFEGEGGRDMDRIKHHVFHGYSLLLKTSDYPAQVANIAGNHHEYYGDESGYSIYRKFKEIESKIGRKIEPSYALTFDNNSVESFHALAFFPAKTLEIIDVFDALTDPSRKYRKGKVFTNAQALDIMKKGFIETHHKIDPLIYDMYVDYLANEHKEDYTSLMISNN